MVEVMSWLPEIENLVAVLNRTEEGRDQMACEKDIKCNDGTKLERRFFRPD